MNLINVVMVAQGKFSSLEMKNIAKKGIFAENVDAYEIFLAQFLSQSRLFVEPPFLF